MVSSQQLNGEGHMALGSQDPVTPQEAGASESQGHLSERLGGHWTPLQSRLCSLGFLIPRSSVLSTLTVQTFPPLSPKVAVSHSRADVRALI